MCVELGRRSVKESEKRKKEEKNMSGWKKNNTQTHQQGDMKAARGKVAQVLELLIQTKTARSAIAPFGFCFLGQTLVSCRAALRHQPKMINNGQ